ncbi:unnamed protein product, partial [Discosporangium mesarthrocarpum]
WKGGEVPGDGAAARVLGIQREELSLQRFLLRAGVMEAHYALAEALLSALDRAGSRDGGELLSCMGYG